MQDRITEFISTQLTKTRAPILPVVTLNSEKDALPLADALAESGIHALEITLRNETGLQALETLKTHRPEMTLCAGSVTQITQIKHLAELELDFVITPGISAPLLAAAKQTTLSILPGISTASDILTGLEYGISHFKFFPAEALGGLKYLKALSEPFRHCCFCPTGGINKENMNAYLELDCVSFIGGSFLTPQSLMNNRDWQGLTQHIQSTLKNLSAQ